MNLEKLQEANACASVIATLANTLAVLATHGMEDVDGRIGKELEGFTTTLKELRENKDIN